MVPVPERIGIMINDNEAYYDMAAEESYKDKRNRLLRHVKLQQEAEAAARLIKEGASPKKIASSLALVEKAK